MLKNGMPFIFFGTTVVLAVFAVGGLLLKDGSVFGWGIFGAALCVVLSLVSFLFIENPLLLHELDLGTGRLLALTTLIMGFAPIIPAVYFHLILGWEDTHHGPWWQSFWGIVVLIDWLTLLVFLPLLTIGYGAFKSIECKQASYLFLGGWIAVCQLVWGMFDFLPVIALLD